MRYFRADFKYLHFDSSGTVYSALCKRAPVWLVSMCWALNVFAPTIGQGR